MKYLVRSAETRDASAMAAVQVETWKTTYATIVPLAFLETLSVEERTRAWQVQLAREHSHILVCEDDGGVFGFASAGRIREPVEAYDAELYAVYFYQRYQRHGAGRRLLYELAAQLRAAGFASMLAWVLEANPSVAFYQKLGAVQVAQKVIEIGTASLTELAMGWSSLREFIRSEEFHRNPTGTQ